MRGVFAIVAALCVAAWASSGGAADYKTLRNLTSPPPTAVPPLPSDAKPRAVQFAKIVLQPQDGEAWAIAYTSIFVRSEGDTTPEYKFLTWNGGRLDGETSSFARVFDDELKKAGFKGDSQSSLFDESHGDADLKVGVLVDDIKGRYCVDCPNLLNPHGIPATVLMTAHWEIYSALERKVIAKITTTGGGDDMTKLQGSSVVPGVLAGFRENVRQLLASEEFRRVVLAAPGPQGAIQAASTPAFGPIALVGPRTAGSVAQAAKSVAVVYAADGQGSGFLISSDGYVLTNQHVVGGLKYVKLKWSNGDETLGEVVRADPRRDVALIKTDPQGRAPLSLRPGPVQQGETVFAIGTPLEDSLQNTMTKGIVSAERVENGLRMIQSDAAINHGNSGGPLIDESGAVVAVAVSGILPEGHQMALNFFIPIDDAMRALALTEAAEPMRTAAPAARTAAHRKR